MIIISCISWAPKMFGRTAQYYSTVSASQVQQTSAALTREGVATSSLSLRGSLPVAAILMAGCIVKLIIVAVVDTSI